MPFTLISDTHAGDPIWDVLSGGVRVRQDAIKAASVDARTEASRHRTDGYLTAAMARDVTAGRQWIVEALTTPVLGRPPRWHRRGDECECLDDDWTVGYEYRIHKFLRRNPSRAEVDRNRQQKADLRDDRLKTLVSARDGDCCRYCQSGPLKAKAGRAIDRRKVKQFDHVDPDRPAGIDGANLVVACARCNERKGHRTPDEADMVLLPVPTPAQAALLRARDQVLRDLGDQPLITDEPTTDQPQTSDPATDADVGPHETTDTDNNDTTTAQPCLDQHEHGADQHDPPPRKGLGWGGKPSDTGPPATPPHPAQPARTGRDSDIWTRRSRGPSPTPGQADR